MRERAETILKAVCLVVAAMIVLRLAGAVTRVNPLRNAIVPALPTLAAGTDAAPAVSRPKPPPVSAGANAPGTNGVSLAGTNPVAGTNLMAGTNPPAGANAVAVAPRPIIQNPALPASSPALPLMMAGAPFGAPPAGGRPLPAAVQAKISRIVDSEILGQIIRPLPMALLGIAGDVAFLRAPSGQTGLVKEGDTLGEIKLLRIGINRVLVEENGEPKELIIFNGFGSDSLLTQPTGTNDEIHTH